MAIWGEGNFDRDDAYDVLGFLFQHIIKEIRDTFTLESEESLYEDDGECAIMANIDILCTLSETYKTSPEIDIQDVTAWKQAYLNTFDRTIHLYDFSSEQIRSRRKVIESTFDRLYKIVVRKSRV